MSYRTDPEFTADAMAKPRQRRWARRVCLAAWYCICLALGCFLGSRSAESRTPAGPASAGRHAARDITRLTAAQAREIAKNAERRDRSIGLVRGLEKTLHDVELMANQGMRYSYARFDAFWPAECWPPLREALEARGFTVTMVRVFGGDALKVEW